MQISEHEWRGGVIGQLPVELPQALQRAMQQLLEAIGGEPMRVRCPLLLPLRPVAALTLEWGHRCAVDWLPAHARQDNVTGHRMHMNVAASVASGLDRQRRMAMQRSANVRLHRSVQRGGLIRQILAMLGERIRATKRGTAGEGGNIWGA